MVNKGEEDVMRKRVESKMKPEMAHRAKEESPRRHDDLALPISEQEESAAESGPLDEDDRLAMRHDFFSFKTYHRKTAIKTADSVTEKLDMERGEQRKSLRGLAKKPEPPSEASSKSVSAPSTPSKRQSISMQQQGSSMTTPRKRGRPSLKRQF